MNADEPLTDTPPTTTPPATTPPASTAPRWLVTDWALAALCVLAFLGLSACAGAVLGLVAALIANGLGPEGLVGLLAGAWLPFAGLGSDTAVGASVSDGAVFWYSKGFALTVTAGMVVLARFVIHAALPKVATTQDFTLAFVAKVAVLGMVVVAILGNALTIGGSDDFLGDSFAVVTQVASAEPAWGAFLLLGSVGLVVARERIAFPSAGRGRWLRPVGVGVAAWAAMVLALGAVFSVAALVASDDATEGLAGVALAPAIIGNGGVSAQAFAMGAANDSVSDTDRVDPTSDTSLDVHLSLFNYDLPPDDDSGAAPVWLFPLLLVAPALVHLATRRWLDRTEPTDASTILGDAGAVAGGFTLASWLGAIYAPLDAGAFATSFDRGGELAADLDAYSRVAVARPSVGGVFGLALLWGLVGAILAAALWSRRRGIDLVASSSSAAIAEAAVDRLDTPPS